MYRPTTVLASSDGPHDAGVLCGVCLGEYCDPVYLSCGHTVCRRCACETLVADSVLSSLGLTAAGRQVPPSSKPALARGASVEGGPRTALPAHTQTSSSPTASTEAHLRCECVSPLATVEVRCPLRCSITTKTTIGGENLEPNTVAMALVESRKATMVKSTLCEAQYCCEEPTNMTAASPATCKCASCNNMLFCGPCFKQHHQRGSFRSHKATEIAQWTMKQPMTCPHHENKERDLLCSCGVAICYMCEKAKAHTGHTSVPLADCIPQKVLDLQGFTKELNDITEKECEASSKIGTEKLLVSKTITESYMAILANLQVIQIAVENRCKEINERAQSLSDFMTHNLDVQFNSLETVMKSHQVLISKANEVVQQANALEVLQAHSTLSSLLSEKESFLDKHRLEPCEQAKTVTCILTPPEELTNIIESYGTLNKGRLPNPPSGGRAPMCKRTTDTIIVVQWEPPSPHEEQAQFEQVVGYNVLVSSHLTAAAASSILRPPSSSTATPITSGGSKGVRKPPQDTMLEVKGFEITKCEVAVEPKEAVSVAVRAVSLVGSSVPTPRTVVPALPRVREVEIFVWGAAGGANQGSIMAGGPGGFSTARLVLRRGTQLTIVVGQGGAGNPDCPDSIPPATRRAYGGGGSGGCGGIKAYCGGAGGGGCSAVMFEGVPLVVAGGGGGSAVDTSTHGFGGGGGGEEGGADGNPRKRGTQMCPGGWGDGKSSTGGKLRGGDGVGMALGAADYGGGGGGGGLYGGAGGQTWKGGSGGKGAKGDTGGGGGSGFVIPPATAPTSPPSSCVVAVVSSRTVGGAHATAWKQATAPPETSNEHYRGGAGACAAPKGYHHSVDGNPGLVVVVLKGFADGDDSTTHVFEYTGDDQSLLIP
ncbi:hypothetical protein Pelo_2647 [Pelomyxa schiedti]|nr:hypothetical protein Pelo_2647 [Pelomyxa schiedti]